MEGFKWHNLCIGIKISLNSGAALLLFTATFFLLYYLAGTNQTLASLYPMALGGLTWAFTGFLIKRSTDKKVGYNAEIEKLKIVTAPEGKEAG